MLEAPTLGELLAAAARADGSAPAFRHRDEIVSYAEWLALADRVAARLHAAGVRRGDVVALWLPSTPLYLIAYLGAARLGAVTTGINVRYRRLEAEHILRRSGARTLLHVDHWQGGAIGAIVDSLRPDLPDLVDVCAFTTAELVRGTHAAVERFAAGCTAAPPVAVDAGDAAAIVFTSGTTGIPKGACYTHRCILALAGIETRRYAGGKIPFQKHLAAGLSFAHVGTMARIGVQIGHQGLSILHDSFEPARVLEEIERERLVHLGGIPTQIILLLDHPDRSKRDLSSLRSILLGGAASSPALIRRIASTLNATISVRYSSTEVGIATASLVDDPIELLLETVGKATPGVELRIVDGGNREVAVGQVGEVVVRSPATMRGYWNAPEETAKVIDADGWVHTGDIGHLDVDGYLRLKGRQSEMYIRGGFNVYPEEVENRLARHPKVARVAVVGFPDDTFGEIGRAFVVPQDPGDPPTLDELRNFVGGEMASFKRPDALTIVADLPVTPMFKVDRKNLKERWLAGE
jgi:acyl-CoA synthetase (AMP-forming)/AMP-acid ligase II